MSACEQIREELSAYLDGELSEQDRSALDTHLRACEACREMLEELKGVSATISDLPRAKAPVSLLTKVKNDIAAEPALREQVRTAVAFSSVARGGPRPRAHWAPIAFGAAALVMLCLLAFLILPAMTHNEDVALGLPRRSATPTGASTAGSSAARS